MKKTLLFNVLILLILVPTAYAQDRIQAEIFEVKLILNGHKIEIPTQYEILNYKGYTYVPLRFLVEELEGKINFHPEDSSINMNFWQGPSLPQNYPASMAEKSGDVVYRSPSDIKNFKNLRDFWTSYNTNKTDWVRIIRYSDEGDPTIQQLKYDGSIITYSYDSTRDKYGKQSLSQVQCKNATVEDDSGHPLIKISGCSGEQESIALISLSDEYEL